MSNKEWSISFANSESTKEELRLEEEITKLEAQNKLLENKLNKLKQLVLLTDGCVSDIVVGETQVRQWGEFCRCFPDEAV